MAEEDNGDYSYEQKEAVLYEMNELFSRYKDHANRQTVHLNRLLEVLQAFGRNPSGADCRRRMHELGEDGKFELTLEDLFQVLEEPWTLVNNERSDLRRALARFAPVGQGFLDIERFRTAMRSLGEPLTDKEIDELIQLGLDNEGGKVEIERLLDHLLGKDE